MSPIELTDLIDEIYLSNKAKIKISEKLKSDELKFWNKITSNKKILNIELSNDTTGENNSFTYFQNLSQQVENVKFLDLFYIQKSYLGNFVTFYLKSRIYRECGNDKMIYPDTIVCDPLGNFNKYFDENWKFLNSHYSELIYIPFNWLERIPKNAKKYKIKKDSNIYELLFGYEGNIMKNKIIGNKRFRK